MEYNPHSVACYCSRSPSNQSIINVDFKRIQVSFSLFKLGLDLVKNLCNVMIEPSQNQHSWGLMNIAGRWFFIDKRNLRWLGFKGDVDTIFLNGEMTKPMNNSITKEVVGEIFIAGVPSLGNLSMDDLSVIVRFIVERLNDCVTSKWRSKSRFESCLRVT